MAAVSTGRSAGGAIRSVPSKAAAPDLSAGAAPVSNARLSRGSSATMLRIPARLMVSLGQRHAVVTALGRLRPSARPRRGGGVHVIVMAAGYFGTSRACVRLPHLMETGGHALSRPFEFTSRAAWFARWLPCFARAFAVWAPPGRDRARADTRPAVETLKVATVLLFVSCHQPPTVLARTGTPRAAAAPVREPETSPLIPTMRYGPARPRGTHSRRSRGPGVRPARPGWRRRARPSAPGWCGNCSPSPPGTTCTRCSGARSRCCKPVPVFPSRNWACNSCGPADTTSA